jgi:hypothetical protein
LQKSAIGSGLFVVRTPNGIAYRVPNRRRVAQEELVAVIAHPQLASFPDDTHGVAAEPGAVVCVCLTIRCDALASSVASYPSAKRWLATSEKVRARPRIYSLRSTAKKPNFDGRIDLGLMAKRLLHEHCKAAVQKCGGRDSPFTTLPIERLKSDTLALILEGHEQQAYVL